MTSTAPTSEMRLHASSVHPRRRGSERAEQDPVLVSANGVAGRVRGALARCYDMLHVAFPSVNVIGFKLSSTGNDDFFTAKGSSSAVGEAYRERKDATALRHRRPPHLRLHGVRAALAEAHRLERPPQGDWNKLMYNLWLAFDGTAQPIPGAGAVSIWYMEGGLSQTAIDTEKQAAYFGATERRRRARLLRAGSPTPPAPAETSSAPDQYTAGAGMADSPGRVPAVRSGLFQLPALRRAAARRMAVGCLLGRDWTPKDSPPGFREATSEATSATVDCGIAQGGRPSADFMPPSTPADSRRPPTRIRSESTTWSPSTDAQSSVGYRVFRDGAHVGTTSARRGRT